MSRLNDTNRRARRRGWPIHGYVGANGGGKSAAMVFDTLPSLEAGRPVLSTVRLLDYETPRPCEGWRIDVASQVQVPCEVCLPNEDGEVYPHGQAHPLWIPFREWDQLLSASKCDVLMDEVTGVASSRESHAMPAPVANGLVQLRRADVVVRWSAPNWSRADKIIREVSQAVTYCRGYWPKASGDADRVWRQRRLFKWSTYDAADFEDFTVGKREGLRTMVTAWHWGPGSAVFSAYDTLDAVLSIGTVSDSGRCYRCGGRRRVPECRCESHARTGSDAAGVPSGVAATEPAGRRVLRIADS